MSEDLEIKIWALLSELNVLDSTMRLALDKKKLRYFYQDQKLNYQSNRCLACSPKKTLCIMLAKFFQIAMIFF